MDDSVTTATVVVNAVSDTELDEIRTLFGSPRGLLVHSALVEPAQLGCDATGPGAIPSEGSLLRLIEHVLGLANTGGGVAYVGLGERQALAPPPTCSSQRCWTTHGAIVPVIQGTDIAVSGIEAEIGALVRLRAWNSGGACDADGQAAGSYFNWEKALLGRLLVGTHFRCTLRQPTGGCERDAWRPDRVVIGQIICGEAPEVTIEPRRIMGRTIARIVVQQAQTCSRWRRVEEQDGYYVMGSGGSTLHGGMSPRRSSLDVRDLPHWIASEWAACLRESEPAAEFRALLDACVSALRLSSALALADVYRRSSSLGALGRRVVGFLQSPGLQDWWSATNLLLDATRSARLWTERFGPVHDALTSLFRTDPALPAGGIVRFSESLHGSGDDDIGLALESWRPQVQQLFTELLTAVSGIRFWGLHAGRAWLLNGVLPVPANPPRALKDRQGAWVSRDGEVAKLWPLLHFDVPQRLLSDGTWHHADGCEPLEFVGWSRNLVRWSGRRAARAEDLRFEAPPFLAYFGASDLQPPLAGRLLGFAQAQDRLRSWLRDARNATEHPRLGWVRGEPGVGLSSLLDAQRADDSKLVRTVHVERGLGPGQDAVVRVRNRISESLDGWEPADHPDAEFDVAARLASRTRQIGRAWQSENRPSARPLLRVLIDGVRSPDPEIEAFAADLAGPGVLVVLSGGGPAPAGMVEPIGRLDHLPGEHVAALRARAGVRVGRAAGDRGDLPLAVLLSPVAEPGGSLDDAIARRAAGMPPELRGLVLLASMLDLELDTASCISWLERCRERPVTEVDLRRLLVANEPLTGWIPDARGGRPWFRPSLLGRASHLACLAELRDQVREGVLVAARKWKHLPSGALRTAVVVRTREVGGLLGWDEQTVAELDGETDRVHARAALASGRPVVEDVELSDPDAVLLHQVPFPIARLYRQRYGTHKPEKQLWYALMLAEGVVRFLAYTCLAQALQADPGSAGRWQELLARPTFRDMSILLASTLKAIRRAGQTPFIAELDEVLPPPGGDGDLRPALLTAFDDELTPFRNHLAHVDPAVEPELAQRYLEGIRRPMAALLRAAVLLRRYHLGAFQGASQTWDRRAREVHWYPCMGGESHPAPKRILFHSGDLPRENALVLVDSRNGTFLEVSPLLELRAVEHTGQKSLCVLLSLTRPPQPHSEGEHSYEFLPIGHTRPLHPELRNRGISDLRWAGVETLPFRAEELQPLWAMPSAPGLGEHLRPVARIALGSSGEVWEVQNTRLGNRRETVKILRPELVSDGSAHERIAREGRVLAELAHHRIVRLFDEGTTSDGRRYLRMEYLAGLDLEQHLKCCGPLPADQAVELGLHACEALSALHCMNVTHRDVKPSNFMLTDRGLVLIDLGIATRVGMQAITHTAALMGTEGYMAPEQRSHAEPHPGMDVYGMGCLLYALLTAQRPPALEPPSPPMYLHASLRALISRATHPDPRLRLPSIGAFAEELSSWRS